MIQVSGTFGSRQEEAQRLGRILRPKEGERPARFYTLVTRDTREMDFAHHRQLFLTEQGYSYEILDESELISGADHGSSEPAGLQRAEARASLSCIDRLPLNRAERSSTDEPVRYRGCPSSSTSSVSLIRTSEPVLAEELLGGRRWRGWWWAGSRKLSCWFMPRRKRPPRRVAANGTHAPSCVGKGRVGGEARSMANDESRTSVVTTTVGRPPVAVNLSDGPLPTSSLDPPGRQPCLARSASSR